MKHHLGKLAAGLATAMIVAAPFAAGALSVDEIQSKIAELLKQVSTLQAQIKVLQGSTASSPPSDIQPVKQGNYRICALLTRNLGMGAQGDDVSGLQEFLQSEGYLSVNPTGYFGAMTSAAVAKWQAKEGVTAAGVVGPMSRERLKVWCGGGWGNRKKFSASPTRGDAPLTVVFDTWLSGFRVNTISYEINYGDGSTERAADCYAPADACLSAGQNKHTYNSNGTYTATLNKITNTCPPGAQCFAGPMSEVVAKQEIVVGPIACTLEYSPVCGAKQVLCIRAPCNPVPTTYGNKCAMNADGATFLYAGECRDTIVNPESDAQCKSWNDGCNSCGRTTPGGPAFCTLKYCTPESMQKPYCTGRFDSTENKPPTISGFSGPTTLAINSTGTWTINASDPEGGTLTYQIWWGDENVYAPMMNAAGSARDFVQSTTFTHSYANAGTYTVAIVVRDGNGQEAKTSTTVKVGSDGVVCTMEYAPVCGQPAEPACRKTPPFCAIATQGPTTYSNVCMMNAAGASFLYIGACTNTGIYY